jgi:hypothetical protein
MSLKFPTTGLKKPSGLSSVLPNKFKRPAFGTLYGFDAQGEADAPTYSNTLALELDGTNDYLAVSASSDFSFGTGNFSTSLWFKAEVITSNLYYALYDFRGSGTDIAPSLYLATQDGFRLYAWNGSSAVNYNTTPTAGQWYHVAYTRSGTTGTIYLNGASVATGTDNANYNMSTPAPRIGGPTPGVTANHFNGKLDELSVFDSALSASNITAIYNNKKTADLGTNGLNLSPVGYWRMGDGTGDTDSGGGAPTTGDTVGTVIDLGAGGNNGTGTNGALYSNDRPYSLPSLTNTLSAAFDGTDDELACTIPTSLLATDFTTSIWVKFPQDATAADGAIFAQNYNASGKVGWRLYFDSTNGAGVGNLSVWASNGSGAYDNPIANVSVDLGNDTWTHLVWGRASGTQFLYRNGSAVSVSQGHQGFNSSSSSYSDTSPAFTIFANVSTGSPVYAEGSCDEVAIWDSALRSTDVTAIYNNGAPPDLDALTPTTLKPEIWYRMGDGTGDTDSGGGAPASGDTIGTIVNQGAASSSDATNPNGVLYSNSVPS